MMIMNKGEPVRQYLVALCERFGVHTPHRHSNVVLQGAKRADVIELAQAQMVTADVVPDDPSIWSCHCHIDNRMKAGMAAFDQVKP